jgi:hypothetical protein
MKCLIRIAVLAAAALTIVAAPNGAWARKGGGGHGSGAHSSGARGGFHHHHRARFAGGFFVGAPFGYQYYPYYPYYVYAPPPYYYGPDYTKPQYELPTIYVEKFEGTPTPETQGDIFCPDQGAYYPDVKDCRGGWQREFQAYASPD